MADLHPATAEFRSPPTFAGRFRSALFRVAYILWTTLLCVAFLPVAPFASPRLMRRYAAFWQRGLQALLGWTTGIRHMVEGLHNLPPQPVILAAKHQSAWETVFFHTIRPDIVIPLKQELGRVPVFGWYLKIGRNIFVDRRGAARALRSLVEQGKVAVAEGTSILIFPEGTRTAPGAPADYKSGVAALYAALGVPVIPVALNSGLFWRRGAPKRAGTITVAFLEPIPPGLDRKAFMALLEQRIERRTSELVGSPAPASAGAGPARVSLQPD